MGKQVGKQWGNTNPKDTKLNQLIPNYLFPFHFARIPYNQGLHRTFTVVPALSIRDPVGIQYECAKR